MLDKQRIRDFAKGLRIGASNAEGAKRLADFLFSLAGEEAEDDELEDPATTAMDSRGRRIAKPASPAERAMFEASIGMKSRRIRNLGN